VNTSRKRRDDDIRSTAAARRRRTALVRSSFCAADITDIQQIIDDVEDKHFSKIHNNPSHILALFLHERRSELTYSLRTRRHYAISTIYSTLRQ